MDLGAPFDSLEELADGSRASLDGDSASVASLDRPAAPSPVEMRRDRIAADDAASPTQPPAAGGGAVALRRQTHDRRRAVGKPPPEERTGFARIYFENQNFTSSTVFKLYGNTTVLEVRKSMANKIKIPLSDFEYYVIVVVFPTDSSLSARTLRDDEMILPLMDTLNRQRSATEADGSSRSHPRHQSRPPVKFVLKDVRGTPIDLDQSPATPVSALSPSPRRVPSDSQALTFPVLLGKGVHSGYLQKASLKDPNVWRKRWFIVKGDQLLYCKSSADQRDVTAISLLNAYLAKARPEVRVPYSFELRTPRRTFQLCANSKDEMVAWIHALHVQIGISSENHRLYEAEILITEDAVSRSEGDIYLSMHAEPSLLQRVLAREDTLKLFRDFVYTSHYQSLLDTWIECELYRRSSLARENGVVMGGSMGGRRSSKDEWDHLKEIIRAVQMLNVIQIDEMTQLRQSFQSEQISRRLSIALHADSTDEYPPGDILLPVQQKLFQALEAGPFQQFLLQNGYRLLLERTIGRIA